MIPTSMCDCHCHNPDYGMHVKHIAPCCYPDESDSDFADSAFHQHKIVAWAVEEQCYF